MKSLRLPLESGKYAYIEVKAVFTDCMEVHIVDRTNVKSGVSIMDCIEEVQEAIIHEFGAKDFVMDFLQHSNWYLYSKHGKVGDYRTIEGVRELQVFDPALDQDLVKLAMERSGVELPKETSGKKKGRVLKSSMERSDAEMPEAFMMPAEMEYVQLALF